MSVRAGLFAPPRRDLLLAGGDRIRYSDRGRDGDAQACVVAVHGFRGTDQGLSRVLAPISGARVVCPNLPGTGVSPVIDGRRYDFDALVAIVADFIETLAPTQPVILLGHSYGTSIVSAVAARHPDLLTGLILVSPIGVAPLRSGSVVDRAGARAVEHYYGLVTRMPARIGVPLIQTTFPGVLANYFMARHGISGIRNIVVRSREHHEIDFDRVASLDGHVGASSHDCLESAPLISTPSAIVAGGADQLTSAAELADLVRTLAPVSVEVIPGAGHLMHHEDLEAVSRAVSAAVDLLAPPPPA